MAEVLEIDLENMPVGDMTARRAFVRPGAVLARVALEQNGTRMSRRVDLGKGVFIDHSPDGSGEIWPPDQSAAICEKILQAISAGGPLAEAYRCTPTPATIVLQPF